MDVSAPHRFSSGLYVVSAEADGDTGACVINTGLQLTSSPLQVEVVINKQNHTADVVQRAGHFALCPITQEADMLFIGRFGFRSSAEIDKFEGIAREVAATGDPYTPLCAAAVIACEVVQTLDVGTHIIFVGRVVDAQSLSDEPPLTYAYYHTILKGKTPPRASSYTG